MNQSGSEWSVSKTTWSVQHTKWGWTLSSLEAVQLWLQAILSALRLNIFIDESKTCVFLSSAHTEKACRDLLPKHPIEALEDVLQRQQTLTVFHRDKKKKYSIMYLPFTERIFLPRYAHSATFRNKYWMAIIAFNTRWQSYQVINLTSPFLTLCNSRTHVILPFKALISILKVKNCQVHIIRTILCRCHLQRNGKMTTFTFRVTIITMEEP